MGHPDNTAQEKGFMPTLDQAELLGQLIRGTFFAGLLIYTVRDLIRGENGITVGLCWLALGSVIASLFSIIDTLADHTGVYETLARQGTIAGIWAMNLGAFLITRSIIKQRNG